MAVTPDFIEHLYTVPKRATKVFGWQLTPRPYVRFVFDVPVVSENGTTLVWRGWHQVRRGLSRHGFKLLYAGRYDGTGQRVHGVGLHKHRYHSELFKHDTYAIPPGEISISDPNEAVFDFADECSISMPLGFQPTLF